MFRYFALILIFFTSFLVSCKTISEQKEHINAEQTTTVLEDAISDDPSLEESAAEYANQLELKYQLEGYYFGHNDQGSVYVILSPYVYKLFTFPEYIDLKGLAMPLNGMYDVIEGDNKTVSIKDYSEGSDVSPSLINLKVNDDGSLYYESKDLVLEKVGPNFVPGLFHFHRALEHDEGYIASYDSNGFISMQHDFFEDQIIFDQEALDLTKLGYMYQHGKAFHDGRYETVTDQPVIHEDIEIPMDKGMAFDLYQKAADLNYPPAMFNLASFYYEGIVVEKDAKKAVEWLTAAANAGHTSSEELLATILYWGDKGVPADREYARYLWNLAAVKGNAMAQYYFGDTTFELEDPTTEDYVIAEYWLEAAAGKDVAEAYTTLYFINKARAENNPDTHYEMLAMQYLLQARYLGDSEAITIYNNFANELLGNKSEPSTEENSLKDNEIAIVADGIYVQVREAYGDKEIILKKQFGEMEIVTFERDGPVDIAFTEGSKIRVLVGDGDPIKPNTDESGTITVQTYQFYKELNKDPTNKPLTKESFEGHYFTYKENEQDEGEYRYIILMPHIYISYKFEDSITFEEFQKPSMGTWGINENKPWLINLDIRMPGSDFIFEEHLEITEDRNLKVHLSQTPLTKVNENVVPTMFHMNRSLIDAGHTNFAEGGRLVASKAFSDNREIYSEKGLDHYNMGVFYETGTTAAYDNYDHLEIEGEDITLLEVDLKEALYHYKLSAEMNYPPAMFNLGAFYEHGMGCEPDIEEALKWHTASAQAGYTAAIYKLGKMHAFGKGGLPVDEEKAIELFLEAAKNGSPRAEYNVGLHYFYDDLLLEVDLEKAEMYLRRAASKGHADAYLQLAKVYYKNISNDEKNDILGEEMWAYVLTAADLGSEEAISMVNSFNEKHND
jgi:TPR repeat protein